MKTRMLVSILILVLALLFLFFLPTIVPTGKVTLTYAQTFNVYAPVYMSYDKIRIPITSNSAQPLVEFGKIYIKDDYIFVNELYKGVHVINNHDPSNPEIISFIKIPGNVDIAIRDNILYADSWVDLVVIDISDPANVTEIGGFGGVFPNTGPTFLIMEEPDVEVYFEEIYDYMGIVVDWELVDTGEYRRSGGCFPAGTEVLTAHGPRAIETVKAGTEVYTCDVTSGEWTLARVHKQCVYDNKDDIITIQMDSINVEATEYHPFYVLRGDGLATRPLPKYVPEEDRRMAGPGRWVEAHDLKKGDVLWSKNGGEQIVTSIINGKDSKTVYHLEVEGNHNFAVHESGILVHNKKAEGGGVPPSSSTGKGGSLARFTIVDDYLYVLSGGYLHLFEIKNPESPSYWQSILIGWDIETIFPHMDKLFIGGQEGMYIYDNSNPANPVQISRFSHVTSCDPVVVEGNYAYVTLRGGTRCQGMTNRLEIIDISNIRNPRLIAEYPMDGPYGLGIDRGLLFICDGDAGLKLFDATVPYNLKPVGSFPEIKSHDVILHHEIAILVGREGLYQYDYHDVGNILLISAIVSQKHLMKKLLDAVKRGNTETVKSLLEVGAFVEARDPDGFTSLMIAAASANVETVKVLLIAGADVNAANQDGSTALFRATRNGNIETVKVLVDAGAELNAKSHDGFTSLLIAAQSGNVEVVKVLLDAGADINAQGNDGYTAIIWASRNEFQEVAKLLIEVGADVNAQGNDGYTALMWATQWETIEVAKLLIEVGADVDAQYSEGNTALMNTFRREQSEVFRLLIEVGADINVTNNSGETVLIYAIKREDYKTVKELIELDADVNIADSNGMTALMYAVCLNNFDNVNILVTSGANINVEDVNGETPLIKAARCGPEESVKLLLDKGADVYHKDNLGKTPLNHAVFQYQEGSLMRSKIIKMLRKAERDTK